MFYPLVSSKAVRENIYYSLPPSPSSLFCTLHPSLGERSPEAGVLELRPPCYLRNHSLRLALDTGMLTSQPRPQRPQGTPPRGLQHHSLRLLGLHLCPNPLSFPRPVLSSRLTGWLHPRPPKVREGSPGTIHELRYQVSL